MEDNLIARDLVRDLEKEIPILTAQIRAVYAQLDKRFKLNGARIPITFGYDRDLLGSYTQPGGQEKEHFHFSLLFIGYALKHPMKKEDRMDLYKHEYAHYMQHNLEIPREYCWQPGLHGSAWKYCCSLIGAAPTPYYKVGEALQKHNYEKALKNPVSDKTVVMRDRYRREVAYQNSKNSQVKFAPGDQIEHPKFGTGYVERTEQLSGSVRLHVRFGDEVKMIDQKWLLRTKYQRR